MRVYMITLLLALALTPMAYAQEALQTVSEKTENNVVHIGVNGMVCDFCAQSLKIVFMEQEAVKDVAISLEKKQVTLFLKPDAALDDATITKLITDSGYDVADIKRNSAGE